MKKSLKERQVIEAMMRDTETVADADDEIRAVLQSALTRADAMDTARCS